MSVFLLLACAGLASAATPPQEVDGMIDALGQSDCQFERNGSWHTGAEAKQHLQRKYDWLRKRDMVATPEQFIQRAASRSSLSGKPYHVRCPGKGMMESATWFRDLLRRQRGARASPGTR